MKIKQLKKTLCLVLTLSLVGGWFHLNSSGAEEYQQPTSEPTIRSEMESSPEEISGLSAPANQEETKELKKTNHKELLKNVGLFVFCVAALPVAYVATYAAAAVIITVYGPYYCGREIGKLVKKTFAQRKNKGASHEEFGKPISQGEEDGSPGGHPENADPL